jgi:hypothetical protein
VKSRTLTLLTAMVLFAAVAAPAGRAQASPQHHHYALIDLGTFGGPSSYFSIPLPTKVMNNRGVAVGWADTALSDPFPSRCFNPDCLVSHAAVFRNGSLIDLGTLANGWSSEATWISDAGMIAGISQNGLIDPLIGLPEQRAVVWRNGAISNLGTLGGNQSLAAAVNSLGQVAGSALNTTPDPFSMIDVLILQATNGTQTRAIVWDRTVRFMISERLEPVPIPRPF